MLSVFAAPWKATPIFEIPLGDPRREGMRTYVLPALFAFKTCLCLLACFVHSDVSLFSPSPDSCLLRTLHLDVSSVHPSRVTALCTIRFTMHDRSRLIMLQYLLLVNRSGIHNESISRALCTMICDALYIELLLSSCSALAQLLLSFDSDHLKTRYDC